MKYIALALTAATLVLTGCNNTKPSTSTNSTTLPSQPTNHSHQARSQSFLCDNGMAPVLNYVNNSQATITLEGTTTTLNLATAASGERYVTNNGIFGHGGEWHQKGNMAVFSYKTIAGNPATINCTAE